MVVTVLLHFVILREEIRHYVHLMLHPPLPFGFIMVGCKQIIVLRVSSVQLIISPLQISADCIHTTLWSNAVMRHSTNLGNMGSNPAQARDLTRLVAPFRLKAFT